MTGRKEGSFLATSAGILIVAVLCCIAMYLVETVIIPSYALRSLLKILLFLLPPAFCSVFGGSYQLKNMFILPSFGALVRPLLLGLGVYVVIMGAWQVLGGFISTGQIVAALENNIGVTGQNFIWVSLYISFINSLLEEFFFRGFLFLGLRRVGCRWACLISAGTFALYHVAMLRGWFSPILFILAMAGLFVGGLVFNWLDSHDGTIYSSWLTHMFANFAINTIGFMVLGTPK